MNNFGVIEVASNKTKHAPGWAYVPDSGPNPAFNQAPGSRKNRAARNQTSNKLGLSDLSARQDAKLRKELEALDKDPAHRDVSIPAKSGGGRSQNKHTPNVRKILQSQKTFANHLDDYIAMGMPDGVNSQATTGASTPVGAGSSARRASTMPKNASKGRQASTTTAAPTAATTTKPAPEPSPEDTPMPDFDSHATEPQQQQQQQQLDAYPPDGTILPAYARAPPTPHPGDADPLLVSRSVPFPTDAELRALMAAAPLNYLDARAGLLVDGDGDGCAPPPPPRKFCEVCGYWGRVKCGKCGGRVCALDCLETHREECTRRYGH